MENVNMINDENIDSVQNIKSHKYENIYRNINKILISINIQKIWQKFIKKI